MATIDFEQSEALQLLQELERRQDEALLQIDQLNDRIEKILAEYAPPKIVPVNPVPVAET